MKSPDLNLQRRGSYQDPHMIFMSSSSEVHMAARCVANRHARTDPKSALSIRVRKADAYCKQLYEDRAEAMRILRSLDKVYQETWETVYKMATGEEE